MILEARKLIALPRKELWDTLNRPVRIKLRMDDGVLETSSRAALLSLYCSEFYQRFPKTPVLMHHQLGDRQFTGKEIDLMINRVYWDCYDTYRSEIDTHVLDRELLNFIVGEVRNAIYNDFTYNLESYVQTLSATDLIDTVCDEEIAKINNELEPNHRSIDNAYRRITKILHDKKKLPNNRLARGCRWGIYKVGQVLQCVTARGYTTDYDNNIFRKPVLTGFIHGLRKIVDIMKESRTAAKAQSSTDEPLQKSQYFNRRLQILADVLTDIIPGDCGSTRYLEWFVSPEDVEDLDGMYYVDGNELLRFDATTAKTLGLIGKTMKFRSVLYCDVTHPRGCCERCYGELAIAIPFATVPGHIAATIIGKRISQNLLSTKHLDRSATSNGLEISAENQKYIKFSEDRNTISLSDEMEGKKIHITLDAREAGRLADVLFVDDIDLLQTSLVSSITRVQFTIFNKKNEENIVVPVYSGKRTAAISKELLQYAKEHRWELTPNGNYSIDMRHWDMDLPLFTLPLKNANMLDYMKTIESFLTGAKSNVSNKTIRQCKTPDEALREFHAIVSTQMHINLVYLQVIIKVSMIRSSKNFDYRMPLPGNVCEFGKYATLIAGRSASAILAYQNQRIILSEPQSYLIEHRPDHPLDQLLKSS